MNASRIFSVVALFLSVIPLASCKSSAEQAQEAAQEREKIIAQSKETCREFGHAPGSQEHSRCVEDLFHKAVDVKVEEMRSGAAVAAARRSNQVFCNRAGNSVTCF